MGARKISVKHRLVHVGLSIVAASYLCGAGCNLFETRTPDTSEDELDVWEPPTSPEVIVRNLENALESGTFNNYQRALTEDFVFIPEPGDVFTMELERPGEGIYENWTREVETSTAEEISLGAEDLQLELTNPREELDGQATIRKYLYALTLIRDGAEETYAGDVWFHIRQEPSGEWLIFEWEDKAIELTDSWGLLKGRSRILFED